MISDKKRGTKRPASTPYWLSFSVAAMGERAECVMLNKGPHVLEALRLLNDILMRMQGHTGPVLRELKMARDGLDVLDGFKQED